MQRKIYYLYLREMDQKPSLTSLNKQLCPYKPLAWWRCGGGSVTVQRRRQLGGGAVAVAAAVAAARQCNGGGGMRNGDATATEGRSSSTISRSRRRRSRASMTRVHFLSLRWVAGNGRGSGRSGWGCHFPRSWRRPVERNLPASSTSTARHWTGRSPASDSPLPAMSAVGGDGKLASIVKPRTLWTVK